IMAAGGFDAVIGNPPYVRPHKIESEHKEYFWQTFSTFVKKSDLYCCFIERAINLLNDVGRFGMIVSNSWLRLDSFEKVRVLILSRTSIEKIIDFTDNVFVDAAVKTNVLLLSKPFREGNTIQTDVTTAPLDVGRLELRNLPQSLFQSTYKHIFDLSIDKESEEIKAKMRHAGQELGHLFSLSFGIKTGDDSRFLTYEIHEDNQDYKKLLRGENISRYGYEFVGEYVQYLPEQMKKHRRTARPGTKARFEQPKVLVRDTGEGLRGTFENEKHYVKDVLVVADKEKNPERLKYLTGLLNSTLLRFYYETSFPTLHVQRNELASLPIHTIDFNDPDDVQMFNDMVKLVDEMLRLHKQLPGLTGEGRRINKALIDTVDSEIDALVYRLYGLSEEDVAIVAGG
ncbi:MAG: Eco57I restriction-modification methylase domain-containing protein, partial [Chloroflexota bacterium]|nr:Eco57I restriction-modification methylase domain-containing protein [Chloroflexota bacterium]